MIVNVEGAAPLTEEDSEERRGKIMTMTWCRYMMDMALKRRYIPRMLLKCRRFSSTTKGVDTLPIGEV